MLRQFSSAVSQIYAAATNSQLWRSALIAVESLTGSTGAVINLIPMAAEASPTTLAGSFSEENCAEYASKYMALCPRIRFGMQHPGRTQVDYMFISESEMDRDPVYAWYSEHGLRYHIAGTRQISRQYMVGFSVQRTRRQGHPQAEDVRLFELVKPHLSQALGLAEQLNTLRHFEKFSSSILETLPQAVFGLDQSQNIVFANAAAEALLLKADGLRCADGKLHTRCPSEQPRLDEAIHQSCSSDLHASSGWVRVSRSGGGPPYAAFVAPLNCEEDDLIAGQVKVLIIVRDPGDHRTADPQMLMEVYQLTHAEARLANALCGGHSIESAASLLGVQPATVRSQLKSVFRKTGVSRQQDLMRFLANLSTSGEFARTR